ncbi:hypothetical protein KR009_001831 [Drosophila setifemur]|nr:hypothetical protein KR009_001831 [Drosophila setifemur]
MEESEDRKHVAVWTFKRVVPLVIYGYILGIIIALYCSWWHPTWFPLDLGSRWMAIVLGVLVFILLFYDRAMRCILVMTIPELCGSRGRAFLLSVAFVIAVLGPTLNIIDNLKVLMRSLACNQVLLSQAIGQMLDVIMEPVHAVQLSVDLMLNEVRGVLKGVMVILVSIQVHLIVIIDTLKNGAAWLKSVVDLCNAEMGTPWGRCKKSAKMAMERCRDKLGNMKSLCHASKLFLALCYPAKLIDVFCSGYWDLSWTLLDRVLERRYLLELCSCLIHWNLYPGYQQFVSHIEQMFDANITFGHEFSFETNTSKSTEEVGEEVIEAIEERLHPFEMLSVIVNLFCWVTLFTVLLKSTIFFLRYTHSRPFQNVFITELLEEVDAKNKKHGSQALFPLHRLERHLYMRLIGRAVAPFEFLTLVRDAFFLATISLQLFGICFLDYALFWLLATISYYAHQESGLEVPAFIDLEIKGGGFVGDTMRGIANAFRPLTQMSVLDSDSCIPLPEEPDYWNYYQIGGLCLISWFMLLTEPYVLRSRHTIMACFYPDRAYERAVFMHWSILRNREFIFKFARRKARNKHIHKDNFKESYCISMMISILVRPAANHCNTPGCPGNYCDECFESGRMVCCLCQRPLDYADYSDCSEVE